jgi:hypothetical protein
MNIRIPLPKSRKGRVAALTGLALALMVGAAAALWLYLSPGFGETPGNSVGEAEHNAPNLVLRSGTVTNLMLGKPVAIPSVEAYNGGTQEGRVSKLEVTTTNSRESEGCRNEWFHTSGEITTGLATPVKVPPTGGGAWTTLPSPQLELANLPTTDQSACEHATFVIFLHSTP